MVIGEYNDIVREYSNRVCRFADKMLMDKNMAKDITQDAFLRLWQHREEIEAGKAKAWLFTTTYRLCIDYLSKKKRYSYQENVPEKDGYEVSDPDLLSTIHKVLHQLPDDQRSIVLLRDYEGYSYSEIGEMLNLSESKVKVYLFRARTKIKNYIKDLKLVL